MTRFINCLGLFAGAMTLLAPGKISAELNSVERHADYIVLLHGMGRTSLSMIRTEHFLEKQGYRVINLTYHSRRLTVEQLSEGYLRPLLNQQITDPNAKVHFVTHSLGGIILRQYLSNHTLANLGRVVMLGPPNHGSEVIDHLRAHPVSREFLGASAHELGTGPDSLPHRLGPVYFPCGIIAGDRSFNPFLSSFLPRPNDGKVSVASAQVEGMSDFLVLHSTHTWLMCRNQTLRQTLCFLKSGQFDHRN